MTCIDCGKQLGSAAKSHGTKRCIPCFASTRKLPEVFCAKCGKQRAKSAKYHRGQTLCRSCSISKVWTGRPVSAERREQIRKALLGRHPSEETRAKLRGRTQSAEAREKNRIANSGANNARWKGGLTNARNVLEGSAEYKTWRKAVFEKDNYTCHLCQTRGGYLHAHHVLGFSKHPELRLTVSNGLTLCKPCHLMIHRRLHHEDFLEIHSKGERPSQPQPAQLVNF